MGNFAYSISDIPSSEWRSSENPYSGQSYLSVDSGRLGKTHAVTLMEWNGAEQSAALFQAPVNMKIIIQISGESGASGIIPCEILAGDKFILFLNKQNRATSLVRERDFDCIKDTYLLNGLPFDAAVMPLAQVPLGFRRNLALRTANGVKRLKTAVLG